MSESNGAPDEIELWRRAARRLAEVDPEPSLTAVRVDALRAVLGPRAPGQELRSWLRGERAPATAEPGGETARIIPFNPRRQRFRPVEAFTRLAADSAGGRMELPERELESEAGRFRLNVRSEGDQVVVELQALGFASEEFANRLVGIAQEGDESMPLAVLALDDDADGTVRLPDSEGLRRALLRPVVGLIEEI